MILQDAIKPKTVVWCKTEEEAKRILTEADRLGYNWFTHESYIGLNEWHTYRDLTCYYLYDGCFDEKGKFEALNGYTIINSTEIKTPPQWVPAPQDLIDPETHKAILEAIEEVNKAVEPKALNTQIGGNHYKKYKIQPMEYAMANNLNACQSNVVKYITRYKDKGGVQDLEKAKHCIDLLIELERVLEDSPVLSENEREEDSYVQRLWEI